VTHQRVEALAERDLSALATVWNDAPAASGSLGARYPLTLRALEQWWRSPDTDPGLALAVRDDGGRLLGAVLARAPSRAWCDASVGHVSLLAVAAQVRGRGIGRALWDAALAGLAERGRTTVRLGADPDHLLPGVPVDADDATWRFLLRAGAVPGAVEHDVRVDLRSSRLAPAGGGDLTVVDDAAAALAFVARHFPGRWHDEARCYAEHGVALLTLRDGTGRTLGFAAAFRTTDAFLGPSLTWHEALPGPAGGLGPLGVDPDVRGRGLGLHLVRGGLDWHRDRGVRDVVLNWTTLTPFYGRLGARVWRSYQRAEVATR
jgi:GNAT superfamily N-acetyltransferase